MTPADIEAILLLLARHNAVFVAICADLRCDPERIGRALTSLHQDAVREQMQEMLPVGRDSACQQVETGL